MWCPTGKVAPCPWRGVGAHSTLITGPKPASSPPFLHPPLPIYCLLLPFPPRMVRATLRLHSRPWLGLTKSHDSSLIRFQGRLLPDLPVSGLRMAEKQGREPECPVCWNPFNNTFHTPKVLDCCHSFCVECLAHLSLVTPARRRLLCPLCRQPTVLASGQPVTDLPTDTAVLTLLRLEPHHVILEGRQLCLKDEPKSRYFLRQPRVYTLELGPGPGSQTGPPQDVAPTTSPSPSPSADSLRGCFRNPQFRTFAYLLAVILSAALLLIFSIFWTKQFFGGVG
ncbi:E3 ubiquitin-protein ligase RNF183 isoform X3 [Physeter macrocephalus]|nr:E3 ubiquitin-protein ligase RNF183 isoform X3 [Physeter catodon]|eukprot:XP_028349413.1 E3 ubiquitin-protein ligase RNF183 isoform X1 [Physeter catodon]